DRAVLVGEHHRLLGRQGETPARGVVRQVVGGGLVRQPLAQVALGAAAARGQLGRRGGALVAQRAIQAEAVAQGDQGGAVGAAEVVEDLADEGVQPVLVETCSGGRVRGGRGGVRTGGGGLGRCVGGAWNGSGGSHCSLGEKAGKPEPPTLPP